MNNKLRINNIICAVLALCVFVFGGCGANNGGSEPQAVESIYSESRYPSKTLDYDDDYTLLIYMCGSTLESKNGAATDDISELLKANIPKNINVVIETGGSKRWKKYGICADKLQRYKIADNKLELLQETELSSMANASTLKNFVDWGIKTFPAKRTGLILWDHGGGFLRGICCDELFKSDWLTVDEFDSALSESNLSFRFDFIGFDACLMSNYETVLVVSKYGDYMIASEDDEPTGGWDYTALAEALGTDRLYDVILENYEKQHNESDDCVLSVINLNEIGKLQNVLSQALLKAEKGGISLITEAVKSADRFGAQSCCLYDLGEIADYLDVDCDFTKTIKSVHSENRKNTCGINFCFPADDSDAMNEYLKISPDTRYAAFLNNYFIKENKSK